MSHHWIHFKSPSSPFLLVTRFMFSHVSFLTIHHSISPFRSPIAPNSSFRLPMHCYFPCHTLSPSQYLILDTHHTHIHFQTYLYYDLTTFITYEPRIIWQPRPDYTFTTPLTPPLYAPTMPKPRPYHTPTT